MDEETARRVCELIAGVICSDDGMKPEERAFLKRMLQTFGLDPDTGLMPTYWADVAAELAQLPETARWQTLDLVIQAAAADGSIAPAERAIIDTIAAELGVGQDTIVERLRRALPQA